MSHAALPELLTISRVTIGRVALPEIIIMTSQHGSPTTFVEFQIKMTLARTNLNGNII